MQREYIATVLNTFAAVMALILIGAIVATQMFMHSDNIQKHSDSIAYTAALNRYAAALEEASDILDREK